MHGLLAPQHVIAEGKWRPFWVVAAHKEERKFDGTTTTFPMTLK
jgi:hypothetical protein